MEPISNALLSGITEAVFGQLVEAVSKYPWGQTARDWLTGKPAKVAYQRALAATFTAFSRRYSGLAASLFDGQFLISEQVKTELSRFLLREGNPNPTAIAEQWKQQFSTVPEIDLEEPINYFLGILEAELKAQPAFDAIFDRRAWEELHDIASSTEAVEQSLRQITHLLDESNRLLIKSRPKFETEIHDARGVIIGEGNTVYQYFLSDEQFHPLISKLYSFTTLINEKTKGFVGRQFVFDMLNQFVAENESGYFIIKGEPGIGKTAIAARLVQTQSHIHHFVVASQGISGTEQLLENICVQLIAKYGLGHIYDSARARRDSGYLSQLLEEATTKLAYGERLILVVDALDEADQVLNPRANPLYLPKHLPQGVFLIATTRPLKDRHLDLDTAQKTLYLEAESNENLLDVHLYLQQAATSKEIQTWLQAAGLTVEEFVKTMSAKSEGNFMYLHYVLPEIKKGKYDKLNIDKLPQGLKGYYEAHWRQMCAQDEALWVEYRQPILCFLASMYNPVSAETLAELSERPVSRVKSALGDWWQFLDKEIIEGEERYRIYHTSFQDFLRKKDEVGEIDLGYTRNKIADAMLKSWQALRENEGE